MLEVKRRPFGLSLGATLREAFHSILSNPVNSALNAAGIALGAATAIGAIGVSATSQSQVESVFDAYAQTQVTVVVDDSDGKRLPPSEARFEELPGVVAATTVARLHDVAMAARPEYVDESVTNANVTVFAVGPSAVDALELDDWNGRPTDTGFHDRGDAVAMIGAGVAGDLNLYPPYGDATVQIGGEEVTVIGVFSSSPRLPQLTQAVLVPRSWSDGQGIAVTAQQLVVRVELGAADVIAQRAPSIVNPYEPQLVTAAAPPTVDALRSEVSTRVGVMAFAMAAGALLVGSIGIANAALVGVVRRTGEFSLRRALGATPRDIARLVVMEGSILGLLAGLLGGVSGMLVVVGVSWIAGWTPLLEVGWITLVTIGSSGLGAVFSAYPARRASAIEPATGLRQDRKSVV